MSRVFVKSDQLKEIVYDARLRIEEWKVLFAVNGELDSQGIASFLEMPETNVSATLEKLQTMQFISSVDKNGELSTEDQVAEVTTFESETVEAQEDKTVSESFDTLDFSETEEKTEIESSEYDEAPQEENIFALQNDDSDIELENVITEIMDDEDSPADEPSEAIENTESPQQVEEIEDTSDEDLDKLIGNLLEEETPEEPRASDSAETKPAEEESDFDLGSIFQDEVEEAVADSDSDIEESLDDVFGSFGEEPTSTVEAPPAAAAPVDTGTAPGTVLVVDDSVVIRKMVEIALENESYNIISVATGKEALNYLDDNTPNIIILDIMLSDVNGLDVLKAIKASKDIPVVMLSAKDTPRETTKAKQLGADDFIPKPFKDEDLVGKIKELINR